MNATLYKLNLRPKWQILLFGFILILMLGFVDYLTRDFSLTIFYILPVFIGTWFVNNWAGIAFSFISGVVIIIIRYLPSTTFFTPTHIHIWNTCMEVFFLLVVNILFILLKKEVHLATSLSLIDPLTGIHNRRSLLERAKYEIEQSRRHQRPMTVAYFDLDNFKAVNDKFGHDIGDNLLCIVAQVLQNINRSTDMVARIGGDEFVILFPETTTEPASEILLRIKDHLLEAMRHNNWPVTFSIGAVTFINPPASVEAMFKEADAKMYAVKNTGKNKISHISK